VLAMFIVGCAHSGTPSSKNDPGTRSPAGKPDSLQTISELEKAMAHEARLFTITRQPVQTVSSPISRIEVGAIKLVELNGDSTTTKYFLSLTEKMLGRFEETVSEFELSSLITGIDSLLAISSRPGRPGFGQQVKYTTAGGLELSAGQGQAETYLKGSGEYAFLSIPGLGNLRAAVVAARDSIHAIKK
jgi:hypothetical protein